MISVSSKDHPHACGDKRTIPFVLFLMKGSSPRVWGQAMRATATTAPMRIIPTRVGTSFALLIIYKLLQDHPHACGDKGRTFLSLYIK